SESTDAASEAPSHSALLRSARSCWIAAATAAVTARATNAYPCARWAYSSTNGLHAHSAAATSANAGCSLSSEASQYTAPTSSTPQSAEGSLVTHSARDPPRRPIHSCRKKK